jgi:hypothetical protein
LLGRQHDVTPIHGRLLEPLDWTVIEIPLIHSPIEHPLDRDDSPTARGLVPLMSVEPLRDVVRLEDGHIERAALIAEALKVLTAVVVCYPPVVLKRPLQEQIAEFLDLESAGRGCREPFVEQQVAECRLSFLAGRAEAVLAFADLNVVGTFRFSVPRSWHVHLRTLR